MSAVWQPQVAVRAMRRDDLAAVMDIEQSAYSHPWSAGIFDDCLRVGYRCLVVTEQGHVCGYAIYSIALDEAHLLNLCVSPDWRRVGLASILIDHVLRELMLAGVDRVFLEVRPSNKPALRLYAKQGFEKVGRRPGYYPAAEGREDALVLLRNLDGSLL
ncbi:MAG TPA: ribosomal protein S18-alanine N-acetyltransferase [Wenzhouxiangella sp.]|nr:ribosomal protein S18-alanine N-acetyltransferase [Wenzhouxiangella sp.]